MSGLYSVPLIGRASCPKCHGTGIACSAGVLNADRSAYTFAVDRCDCVTITLNGVPQTFTVPASDVERGTVREMSVGYRAADWNRERAP